MKSDDEELGVKTDVVFLLVWVTLEHCVDVRCFTQNERCFAIDGYE